ncbi:TNFAIP3-interacting protein 1-like [Brachyistius frenatus]|uniref:TNFAIP3-interacting protein 1-like n=1 Tax=Brachyistius frenatus TaxID=100188 RepID=UPI0037E8FBFA
MCSQTWITKAFKKRVSSCVFRQSVHKNPVDRRPVDTSQSTASHKRTCRLYPSLPNQDRYDFCLPSRVAAEFRPESQLEETQSEGVGMKDHIVVLEEQRRELLSINEKWAKEYRTMVQYYKDEVHVLKAFQQHSHFEDGEEHITRKGEGDVSSELLKAEKEAEELRVLNGALTRRGRHQHEEIRRLNEALKEALQTSQSLGVSGETLQDIWKHQAEVYKEDFLKERRDRTKLQEKYLELEKKVRKGHEEPPVLKSPVTLTRCTCTNPSKCPNWQVLPVNQQLVQFQRRHPVSGKQ